MAELDDTDAPRLTFDVVANSDRSALIKISGELDLGTVPELEAAVEPILTSTPDRLVVDVSGMTFADSSAIALWVRWANRIRHVELLDPPPLIRQIIARMGLAERLRMVP